MGKLVITTVGTSIIEKNINTPGEKTLYERIEKQEIKSDDTKVSRFVTDIIRSVRKNFDSNIGAPPSDIDNRLSAEIASLWIMQKNGIINRDDDKIALLYSDTLEGKLAADINEEILREKAGFGNISRERLPGIRGTDANAFEQAVNGNKLGEILENLKSNNAPGPCLICFSGGYKGLVPVLAVFASPIINNINMYYLFEKSDSVVCYKYALADGRVVLTMDETYE